MSIFTLLHTHNFDEVLFDIYFDSNYKDKVDHFNKQLNQLTYII